MKISELRIMTKGEVQLVGDYDEQINEIKDYYNNLSILKIENKDDYKMGFRASKEIKAGQDNIKKILEEIDNEEILNLKKKLNGINKLMASTNTQIKKRLLEYKENEKEQIIEVTFDNITNQENFATNFETFKFECEKRFKGKSSFEEMNSIANEIASNISSRLELEQLKFDKNYLELAKFLKSIDYILPTITLIDETKKIDLVNTIEKVKQKFEKEKQEVESKKEERNNPKGKDYSANVSEYGDVEGKDFSANVSGQGNPKGGDFSANVSGQGNPVGKDFSANVSEIGDVEGGDYSANVSEYGDVEGGDYSVNKGLKYAKCGKHSFAMGRKVEIGNNSIGAIIDDMDNIIGINYRNDKGELIKMNISEFENK